MSNYRDNPSRLSDDEIFVIFDVVNEHREPKEARERISKKLRLPCPHRITIARVFNVGVEFFRRGPNAPVLTTQEAEEIAGRAGYGVSRSRVVELHRLYQLWKIHRREETEELDLDAIVSTPRLERRHKTWILHKYLGLDEKEIMEKLGISSESFWRDIEETEKEGIEKMEPKEVTNALNLGWLMSRFLDCLRTPGPCEISPIGTQQVEQNERLWVEEDPLFPKLKRLLGNKFCRKLNDWKKVRGQYLGKCISFLDTVHQKAEEKSQMKTTEYGEEKGLNDVFWQRIYHHVLLKTKPQPLNVLDRGYLKNLDTTEFVIIENDLVVKAENTVLAKGEPFQLDRVSKAYYSLVADFTSASELKQIWALWQELGTIEKPLNAQAGAVYDEIIPKWFRYQGFEI